MNSIYERMNKIDDNKSLDEKLKESFYDEDDYANDYEYEEWNWDGLKDDIDVNMRDVRLNGKKPFEYDTEVIDDDHIHIIIYIENDDGKTLTRYEADLVDMYSVPEYSSGVVDYIENLPWKQTGIESIDEQMSKIDDKEPLKEKYTVRTLKDVKKLHEAEAPKADRSAIKTRVNELIDMVDWSKWEKFTSTGDDTKPEVKKTKAMDDEIRVDVYLGWDYGHKDDIEEYVKAVNEKFEAFAAIVRKQEPSWSVKLVKSHGSRGVTWTNYWAQVTAKHSITEATSGVDGKRRSLSAEVAQYVENKQRESGMAVNVADNSGYWNTRTVSWKMNKSNSELDVTVTVFYNASALSVRVMDTDGKVVSQHEGISLEDTKAVIDQLFQN